MTTPVRELRRPRGSPALSRALLVAVMLALIVIPAIAGRLADWLWYRDLGFERVFLTKIAAQWGFGLASGLAALIVLYVNARVGLRGVATRNLHIRDANEWAQAGPKVLAERFAAWLAPLVAVFLALVVGLGSASYWDDVARFWFRTPFGISDPVFNRDIAYYVFTVPFLQGLFTFANVILTLALLMTLVVYVARAEIGAVVGTGTSPWRFYATPRTQMHLAALGGSLLVVAALRYLFIDIPSLLIARHPVLFGATYTDLNVRLPLIRVLAVLFVAGAVVLFIYARRAQIVRGAAIVAIACVGGSFLLGGLIPATYQRLSVQPNELARETPQIRHHLAATRAAWGIESVDRRELPPGRQLTKRDIDANQATIRNVRLWDREPLLQTYGQIQSIRTYYDFVSVDDDRYMVNGELRQVLLAPRELNTAAIPNRSFVNEHLTYTHGMGVTLGPSNQVTAEGLPVLWIKDLPPASSVGIRITKPQIYFGELANDFILAPTRQREIDYPSGQGDAAVYTQFAGASGVPIGSFWRRLLFAFRFGSMNILLSDDLTPETRILFHRDVLERARLALPFFEFDGDPFLFVTQDGRLEWMLDGYTVTTRYPYAQPLANGVNYMRNSVKVVIDAYTGTTRAYLADPADPMIRTLGRIYPGLLRPMSEMPADVRAHVRYPGELFHAQSAVYATFHMSDPETFYHREDMWQVPATGGRGNQTEAFMRHIVMRLPGEAAPEFILMRPFTPRQKDNLAAWMVARNDGEHYGKLRVYSFPRQSLVFGPAQIANRINQDTEVARQIALWAGGSEVLRGELLVIPIEESLIYVQPLYLRAQGGRIPELKRVIVAHDNQVAMEETLEAGLARLFGGVAAPPPSATDRPTPTAAAPSAAPSADTNAEIARLLREANDTYERARSAQRAEDWATYGTEMRKLGELLRRLNATRPR